MNSNSESDFIATHVHPAWRDKANYIFQCRIESKNDRNEWEQMWGTVIGDNTFMVCCIPFFVYGLSLGDIIKIDENRNFDIVEKSMNTTIRIWTADVDVEKKSSFITKVLQLSDDAEMHSTDLIAVSVDNNRVTEMLDFLKFETGKSDVIYEIADG